MSLRERVYGILETAMIMEDDMLDAPLVDICDAVEYALQQGGYKLTASLCDQVYQDVATWLEKYCDHAGGRYWNEKYMCYHCEACGSHVEGR